MRPESADCNERDDNADAHRYLLLCAQSIGAPDV